MHIDLREYSADDLWLTEALELDPQVMSELGGPTPRDRIRRIHRRRITSVVTKAAWYFTVIPDRDQRPVGTIGIWESDWGGAIINEIGWMILPAFQGNGYATAAGKVILDRARFERRWRVVHATPSVGNLASNAVCRKLGFSLIREMTLSCNGSTQRVNDWAIELFPPDMQS